MARYLVQRKLVQFLLVAQHLAIVAAAEFERGEVGARLRQFGLAAAQQQAGVRFV